MTRLAFLRRFARDCRAVAAAEMVLILPLATFMLFATVEAGYFMYTEHEVFKSVRDAARWASRQPLSDFGCTATTGDTALPSGDGSTLATVRTDVSNLARYGNLAGSAPLLVNGWQDGQVAVSYSCVDVATLNLSGIYLNDGYAPVVTVIGTPNYPSLFGAMAGFPGTFKLFAKQQAVVVGI